MKKIDISENQVKSIYLGIGSNLGNKRKNIEKAKYQLIQNNINLLSSSNYYESLSWPNPKHPKFLNIVLKISTNLKPIELLKICKDIEIYFGRKKSIKNSPRVIDIDIIDYANKEYIVFDLAVVEDKKPKIEILSSPDIVNNASLSFISKATDDYGIKNIMLKYFSD